MRAPSTGRGPALYAEYQARLRTLNAVDFGDLLLHVLDDLPEERGRAGQYQRWFRYILVDEYQDTNVAQYLWLRLLAQGHRNICCVGDDDQSIYGWRGAEVGNILRFEKDFPGATVIRLEQNYRSTPHILAAASGVIAANKGRLGKTLWTEAKEGEKVRLIGHWDGEEEARWIGEEIEAMQQGTRGHGPDLARRDGHPRARLPPDARLRGPVPDHRLPYRVIGGPRFYERMEIRDAMAYFRLGVSPDDDLAFERIVNTPKRGLGDKAQQAIQRAARDQWRAWLEGARLLLAGRADRQGRARGASAAARSASRAGGAGPPAGRRRTMSNWPRSSSTRRATPRCGRTTRRPRRRAGSRTSRNSSRRWKNSRTCKGSSNMSR
jgi:DNA helicase-2/ATP-dependent DNA helicase PcrA